VDVVEKVVLINELLGNIAQFDANILTSIEGGLRVEVLDVKGA
jgi:hypothetical protein